MQNMVIQNKCFILIISQYVNNSHTNEQLVNSKCTILKCYQFFHKLLFEGVFWGIKICIMTNIYYIFYECWYYKIH